MPDRATKLLQHWVHYWSCSARSAQAQGPAPPLVHHPPWPISTTESPSPFLSLPNINAIHFAITTHSSHSLFVSSRAFRSFCLLHRILPRQSFIFLPCAVTIQSDRTRFARQLKLDIEYQGSNQAITPAPLTFVSTSPLSTRTRSACTDNLLLALHKGLVVGRLR